MPMDTRRMILVAIFAMSLMMLWSAWSDGQKRDQLALKAAAEQASDVPSVTQSAPTASASSSAGEPSAVPTVGANDVRSVVAQDYASAAKALVVTDFIRAEVSALGRDIICLELLKYKPNDQSAGNFILLENGGAHTYLAQSGLLAGAQDVAKGLPDHKTAYELVPGDYSLKDGQDSVVVRLEAKTEQGLKVSKLLTFKRGSYIVDIAYEVTNSSTAALNTHAYWQLLRDGKSAEQAGGFFTGVTTFTGPAFYTDKSKFKKIAFSDVEKGKAEFDKTADNGWVAMVQHYFVGAFLPVGDVAREFYARQVGTLYAAGVILPLNVEAGQTQRLQMPFYIGPQLQQELAEIAPGFDRVVDYGWLTVIAEPLFILMAFIHRFVGNWGWTIILVTILLKAAFFPLSAAGYKSMARMRTLMPRMKQLQERHKNDRMKLNQEMMELYRKEKVNPMGGCLPILVQVPVFIALYWVLLGTVELRQAPWMWWIQDLSTMDPYYILPVIMGVTQLIQTRLNPAPPDPIQAKVMMAMPIVFTFMFLWFPSGLVLYWVVKNTLSIPQQWHINRVIEGAAAAKAK